MTVIAHVGHWYLSGLYVLPAALVGLGLWWAGRRSDGTDHGEQRADEDGKSEAL